MQHLVFLHLLFFSLPILACENIHQNLVQDFEPFPPSLPYTTTTRCRNTISTCKESPKDTSLEGCRYSRQVWISWKGARGEGWGGGIWFAVVKIGGKHDAGEIQEAAGDSLVVDCVVMGVTMHVEEYREEEVRCRSRNACWKSVPESEYCGCGWLLCIFSWYVRSGISDIDRIG